MRAVATDVGCEIVEFDGEPDHMQLVHFPPKVALSRLVKSLKGRVLPPDAAGGTSRPKAGGEFPELERHYWRAKRLWSGSYFAGSVGGAPMSVLRQYIEQQNRPSSTTTQ
jgi:putative transposase